MRKAFDLRPLDFGDVMGRGFSLYAAAFVAFARWFLLAYTLPMVLLTLALYLMFDPYNWVGHSARREPGVWEINSLAAYYWLLKLASVAFGATVGAAGVYYLGARLYVGGQPSLAEVAKAFYARSTHLLGSSLLHLFAVLGITLVLFGLPISMALGGEGSGAAGMAVVLGFLWVPLLGWYLGAYALNVPCVMLDDAQALESFGRSTFLTRGFRMRLLGVMACAGLLVGAPGLPGLLTVPAWIGQSLLEDAQWPLLGDLIRVLWDGVLLPLFFTPVVVFYFDMRCRKEGYDLAVMARNFGIEEGEMMRYRMNPDVGYRPPGYKPPKGRRASVPRMPQVQPQQNWGGNPHWQPAPQWGPPPPGWQAGPPPGWMPPPPPPGWQPGPPANPHWAPPQPGQGPPLPRMPLNRRGLG
ncbi:MAG: hypothetical protein IT464_01960 [Planctomycetes bacterium]|nr:hypothetical protein [Planctomycetota bacterium]